MSDWLTKLEEIEKEATPGPWDINPGAYGGTATINVPRWTAGFQSGDAHIICHLRNRSKEIAALVKSVVELFSLGDYCTVCEDDFEDRTNCKYCQKVWAANKALANLLREGE